MQCKVGRPVYLPRVGTFYVSNPDIRVEIQERILSCLKARFDSAYLQILFLHCLLIKVTMPT